MQLIPAIDIQDGACVRLLRGDFDSTTVYDDDPVSPALHYAELGAPLLHIVDLDGARTGKPVNTDLIAQIADASDIQTGGGLRVAQDIETVLDNGASRAVLGSIAINDPGQTLQLLTRFGADRIVLALDVRACHTGYRVYTHGWTVENAHELGDVLQTYSDHGLHHVLITDIERDGAMTGPNVALYRQITRQFPTLAVQASGGIRSTADLVALSDSGVAAAISGKALLEKRIDAMEMGPYLQSA